MSADDLSSRFSGPSADSGIGDDLEQVLARFEDAWQQERKPSLADYLPREPDARRAILAELVHLDLEYRLRAGQEVRIENYLDLYPELGQVETTVVELITTEFEVRQTLQPCVNRDEFLARFPSLEAQLDEHLPKSTACPRPRVMPRPPARIGRFELREMVGEGTFGAVYKAFDPKLKRTVALKVPRPGALVNAAAGERFLREAQSTAALAHPGIVAAFEAGQVDGVYYLVSEFVPGGTLADLLQHKRPAPEQIVKLLAQIADALEHAHVRGVVHRDLKPSNILLSAEFGAVDSCGPKISDFGLARWEAADCTLTTDGQVLGTPAYMAPEQARGEVHHVDNRSDVYSLGVILYQALTGELPFQGNGRMMLLQAAEKEPLPPRRVNPQLARDLEKICLKAMAKDPAMRYATAAALAADLRRYLDGEPVHARSLSRSAKAWRWCLRRPALTALGAALAWVSLSGMACVLWQWREAHAHYQASEKRRLEAERNYLQARQAVIDFSRLTEIESFPELARKSATRREFHELCKELREKALAYHQEFLLQRPDDPRRLADVARASDDLAVTCQELGLQDEAEDAADKCVSAWQRLVQAHPDNLDFHQGLVTGLRRRGATWKTKSPEAVAAYRSACDAAEHLAQRDPTNDEFLNELAECYFQLGLAKHELAEDESADSEFARAATIWVALAERRPHNLSIRSRMIRSFVWSGVALARMERRADAIQAYQRAREAYERLPPTSLASRMDFAQIHRSLGKLYQEADQPQEALHCFECAKELYTALLADEPTDRDYRRLLGIAWTELATSYRETGNFSDAFRSYHKSCQMLEEVVRDNPDHNQSRTALASAYRSLAKCYDETEQHALAAATYLQAAELHEALVQSNPSSIKERTSLATVYHLLGRNQHDAGLAADAVNTLEKSLQMREELLRLQPDNPVFRSNVDGTRLRLENARLLLTHSQEGLGEADDEATTKSRNSVGAP